MPNQEQLDFIREQVNSSVFSRNRYTCMLEFNRFAEMIGRYIDEDAPALLNLKDLITLGTPAFQRKNDKWDRSRQIAFIENLFCEYRPTIQLYTTTALEEERGFSKCWILDGLQRLTAISDFLEGKFKLFNGVADVALLKEAKLLRKAAINLQVFTFGDDVEAAYFYIQLNKGITHSDADIERAYAFIDEKRRVTNTHKLKK